MTQSRHPGGNILDFSTTRFSAETDEPRLRRAQSRGHHAHVQAEGRALQRDQQIDWRLSRIAGVDSRWVRL